ncbi:predicted protein [Sclerotinia sclerotiorum 1980 UF-70]|uniref:Uncharacterized protein n=2 Tax=Sclerotinia sclerotiorum (strain ATCC 18683 / 1980 / Ss-1) TaxID=665079 RepID=A7EXD7_SCLS1|nr:predicted protein [Sclerotinia sclerotiorum 1980 UF-70]APA05542.1 hypothetical protein sscle_01g003120 [Sclerotinia sclerotiorum 1980 UF-70]EDN94129.1 predicted protein [Sclerotinia sclerotiorum 1980 UF-70]
MDEVKKLYLGRQYKQCTARCINILDSITDPYRVHPLYSLFLSFYCATCLEITASNLHNNSPQKLSLLRDSLLYFQKTEEYLTYADIPMESDAPISGNRSSSMSSTSSARSSVDSVFSSTSFPSTADGLSPAFSSCSFEDGNDEKTPTRIRTLSVSSVASTQSTQSTDTTIIADRPAPLRIKKKVSFSPALPTLISAQDLENSSSMETIPRSIQSQNTLPRPIISSKCQSPSPIHPSLSIHLTSYNLNLSSITTQLTYHIIHINSLIDTIQSVRKSRRSNQASLSPSLFNSTGDLSKEDKEEMRRKEIRERIEKLRSAGWERKRWNGSRSEALREKVDNELNGWI